LKELESAFWFASSQEKSFA